PRDSVMIAMAGPAMNILLGWLLLGVALLGDKMGVDMLVEVGMGAAFLSVLLACFNMIPIPPLDGSHLLRYLTGMSQETYMNFARYGFIILIVMLQIEPVRDVLGTITFKVFVLLASLWGMG